MSVLRPMIAVALWSAAAGCCFPATAPVDAACTDLELVLQGETDVSRTLQANCTYRLAGAWTITGPAAVLTIVSGVTIEAEGAYALRLTEGARLVAQGTPERPIAMRSSDATREGGWEGLRLGGAASVVRHELRHVVVRDGGSSLDPTDESPAIVVAPERELAELLFDHLTIEDPKHAGLRLYRDGASVAPGSTDLVVRGGPGYPLVVEAQHLAQLPARQALASTTPARSRILVYGGNEGVLYGDQVWAPQGVPLELASSLELGGPGKPGSLTVQPPASLLLREGVTLRTTWGTYVLRSTPTDAIAFDQAEEGKPWGSLVLVGSAETPLAHQSVVEGVSFRNGGSNEPMVFIVGPGGPDNPGDCTTGATVTGCTFASPAPGGSPFCLAAWDHSFPYATSNTFDGCATEVKCD